jgi:hypothetical protein
MYSSAHSYCRHLDGGECLTIRRGHFSQGENRGMHLVRLLPSLDALEKKKKVLYAFFWVIPRCQQKKLLPLLGNELQTILLMASA